MLEPMWSCGAALPNSLVDILETGDREEERRGGGGKRGWTSLTLTISVKAMVKGDIHLSYEAHER